MGRALEQLHLERKRDLSWSSMPLSWQTSLRAEIVMNIIDHGERQT